MKREKFASCLLEYKYYIEILYKLQKPCIKMQIIKKLERQYMKNLNTRAHRVPLLPLSSVGRRVRFRLPSGGLSSYTSRDPTPHAPRVHTAPARAASARGRRGGRGPAPGLKRLGCRGWNKAHVYIIRSTLLPTHTHPHTHNYSWHVSQN